MRTEDQELVSAMMDGEWRSLDVRRAIADVCADEASRAKWSRYHLARHALQSESFVADGSLAERISRAIADEPTYSNVTAIGAVATDAPEPETAADAGLESEPDAVPARAAAGERARGASPAPAIASGAMTARTFAAGFGLAASVAVVTAFGLNALRGDDGAVPGDAGARIAATSPVTAPAIEVASSGAAGTAADAAGPFLGTVPGATLPNVDLVANTVSPGAYWTTPDSSARRTDSEARLNMLLSQHIESSPTGEHQGMLPYSRLVGYDERAAVGR